MANNHSYKHDTANIEVTSVGFVFGPATVTRVCTLPKGQVAIRVESATGALTIRVCPGGKIIATNDAGVDAQFIPPAQAPKPIP